MRPRTLLLLPALLLAGPQVLGQVEVPFGNDEPRVTVEAAFEPPRAAPGDTVTLRLDATIIPGYHIYGAKETTGEPSRVRYEATGGLEAIGTARVPDGEKHDLLGLETYWIQGRATITQRFRVPASAQPGPHAVEGVLDYTACTETLCDPPASAAVTATLEVVAAADGAPAFDPADYRVRSKLQTVPATVRAGERFRVVIEATIDDGYHLYGSAHDTAGAPETAWELPDGLRRAGELVVPPGRPHEDWSGMVQHWLDGTVELTHDFDVPEGTEPGRRILAGKLIYLACTPDYCDPPAELPIEVAVVVEAGEARAAHRIPEGDAPAGAGGGGAGGGDGDRTGEAGGSGDSTVAGGAPQASGTDGGIGGIAHGSLWQLFLAAVAAGLFALLMPCTYPMIPITFSFFTKQAEQRGGNVLALALTYGAGIVVMFVLIGLFIGPLIIPFAYHWLTNLVIALAFLVFGLSLIGVFDLTAPRFLRNASAFAGRDGGPLGVFLMGLTLVVATFTCTVPFLGALLGLAASAGDGLGFAATYGRVAFGMAVFGSVMAAPFIWLALMPGKVQAMPRAGEWMHVLKVFLGLVEIAAAIKFLSNVDLAMEWGALPRELFLMIWAAIFLVAGLFLLGVFRMEGEAEPQVGPKRLVFSLATLMFAAYCVYGAMGYRLDGVIMTAIAPPYNAQLDAVPGTAGSAHGGRGASPGSNPAPAYTLIVDDHETAVARAIAEDKLLLINFTGFQ